MFWLIRAAEQGCEEAHDTVTNMAKEQRGVTDQNCVDVTAITSQSRDVTLATFIGKTMFRTIARGHNYITTLQLSHMLDVTTIITPARLSRDSLLQAWSQYFQGDVPNLDSILNSSISYLLPTYLQLLPLPIIWFSPKSSLAPLASSLSLTCHMIITKNRYSCWSNVATTFSNQVDIPRLQKRMVTRFTILPSLIFNILLLLPHLVTDNTARVTPLLSEDYTTLVIPTVGCILTAISLGKPSTGLSLYLLSLVLLQMTSHHLSDLLSPMLPDHMKSYLSPMLSDHMTSYLTADLLLPCILVFTLLPRCLASQPNVQLILQAIHWEMTVCHMFVGPSVHCVDVVLALLGLIHVLRMSISVKKLRVVVTTSMLVMMSVWVSLSLAEEVVSSLSWSSYQSVCLEQLVGPGQMVGVTATCSHFTGLMVDWEGEVESVRVYSKSNMMENLVRLLPISLMMVFPVTCLLGDRYKPSSCNQKKLQSAEILCQIRTAPELPEYQQCHLERFSTYQYLVMIKMPPSTLFGKERFVHVQAEDKLRRVCLSLQSGQKVRVVGRLENMLDNNDDITIIHANEIDVVNKM